jgi:hypothetical protein
MILLKNKHNLILLGIAYLFFMSACGTLRVNTFSARKYMPAFKLTRSTLKHVSKNYSLIVNGERKRSPVVNITQTMYVDSCTIWASARTISVPKNRPLEQLQLFIHKK